MWGVTVSASPSPHNVPPVTTSALATLPKFPFVISPLPPSTATTPPAPTLQGWVRSTVDHLRKHILEDSMRVFSVYIHSPMSGNKVHLVLNLVSKEALQTWLESWTPWFEVPVAFDFTMSRNQSWVTNLLPKQWGLPQSLKQWDKSS